MIEYNQNRGGHMTKKKSNQNNPQEENDLFEAMLKKFNQEKKSSKKDEKDEEAFLRAIETEHPHSEKKDNIDSSADLIMALAALMEEENKNESEYPFFRIYGGVNGAFELFENDKKEIQKITESQYPLPLDTDITKINAYRIATGGYWGGIKSIGNFVINATRVDFESCYDLEKLPPMNTVQSLRIDWCYGLRFFDSNTRVKEVEIARSGIQFLPKSLRFSKINIDSCENLKYIHPSIPIKAISGIDEKEIRTCKMRYMLSEHVSDEEKKLYPIEEKNVLINNPKLRVLPECFRRPNIILEGCEKLEYIHPSINPQKIKGLPQKRICHLQMMYLFNKMSDNDPSFDFWFKRVKENLAKIRE